MDMTSEQIRAARALLRWEQKHLAAAAGIHLQSIKRIEGLPGPVSAHQPTIRAIRLAFDQAGIEFIGEGEASTGGAGVRLKAAGV